MKLYRFGSSFPLGQAITASVCGEPARRYSFNLSRHFPVYEHDEVQVIPRYYALSVTPDLSVVEGQNA
jgi:hypothetical protein